MKIAIVYDRVNKFGGAEQVLLQLHELWPEAPLYTAVYNPNTASWANVFTVYPSFLQSFPLIKRHHEFFPWLMSYAFENFSFDNFDVVISVTSAEAKSIITKPNTVHICYCLTPTRYLWSGYDDYLEQSGLGSISSLSQKVLQYTSPVLRRWDSISASRPDVYIAISEHVKKRIEKYYHRDVAAVIYPPVDVKQFSSGGYQKKTDTYIVVSRLVSYKKLDLLIEVFNILRKKLIIIGQGKDEKRLRQMAKKNIQFITKKLTTEELARYYRQARAFVFAGEEDFGIVACEAQAAGLPVLCYENSGMSEIITKGKTGEVFQKQSVACLLEALQKFEPDVYSSEDCKHQSLTFDTSRFLDTFKAFVDSTHKAYYSR